MCVLSLNILSLPRFLCVPPRNWPQLFGSKIPPRASAPTSGCRGVSEGEKDSWGRPGIRLWLMDALLVPVPLLLLLGAEVVEAVVNDAAADDDDNDDGDEAKRTSGCTISMFSALATATAADGTTARNCSSLGHCSSVVR